MAGQIRTVPTPVGDARLHADRAQRPIAALVLGHGAGGGVDSPDLLALSRNLPSLGISVFRIEQPWRVAGKKVASRPDALDAATLSCVNAIRVRTPLILGGRSAGARVACRLARACGAVGCMALAFPLQPPGRPDVSRLLELESVDLPTVVIQGSRDTFGGADVFPPHVDVVEVPEADHSFKVLKGAVLSQEEVLALVVESAVEWVTRRVA